MTANEANATFPDKTKQEYGHSSSLDSNGGTEEELRREVQKLKQQLEEILLASSSVSNSIIAHPDKSGYLFKWQDRSIGWSGTKWGLRFVRLNHGQLSYYRSHEERSPRYILTLKNCAVRDEGWKVNKRHNKSGIRSDPGAAVGSHFHVFSIYQRPVKSKASGSESEQENQKTKMIDRSNEEDAQNDDENEIVPLLRFSTESLAEKNQWIDLISKACAYCDTEEFTLAQQQQQNLQEQQHQPPSHAEKGTLPALYFEPHRSISSVPSGYGLDKMGKRHQKKSAAVDAARSNKISYPPSKPMHRQSNPSYLSEGAHVQNYRGMFNLLVIILIVSNFRLLLDTVSTHGFILGEIGTLSAFWEAGVSEKMADFPFVSGLMIVQVFIVGGYCIEKMLSRGWVGDRLGLLLHVVNTNASLGVVMGIVWNYIDHPVVGAALIMQAAITWLKLISYAHANYDYRVTSLDKHMATVALVKDLDADGLQIAYPQNITLANIYFFWFAPTLTYQIAYPRTPFTRWIKVAMLTIHLFVSATLIAFLAAQVIAPNLDSLMKDLEANKGALRTQVIGDYLLKLSVTSTYIWLLVFYGFFHCFLNLSAELLRFGDRVFYRDWWNASEVSAYWRLWNMPVHYWLVRHVYFPSIRIGLSKKGATFIVFLVSAVMHEVLISVPCHMMRAWSFLAMMGQIPLIILTKYIDRKIPGSSIGNVIFWISFCFVGQPMAMLLYTIDYWEMHQQSRFDHAAISEPAMDVLPKQGIPFAAIGRIFGASSEL